MPEPEFITIVEGPTPEFRPSAEFGIHSILEGPTDSVTAMCELRTLNGKAIVARCQKAWKDGRPVRLDFPDHMRMRQELDIAALRLSEIEEGRPASMGLATRRWPIRSGRRSRRRRRPLQLLDRGR
ncbi:MAG: hypothetical protein IPL28_00255 [Chloroflexi bacterium]|nr:hypothetical protein [Chloroflexota bacterium]